MKTQQSKKTKTEVYSVSGFKDTLASPVFYPVVVVAMVLGVTSMFGFVQNPLKLKSMVDVIHEKVNTTDVVNSTLDDRLYNLSNQFKSQKSLDDKAAKNTPEFIKDFEIDATAEIEKMPVTNDIERIAFNYDIASENFWSNLDSSKLETAKEEMERKQRETGIIGAPLRIQQQQPAELEFNLNDETIYALDSSNKI